MYIRDGITYASEEEYLLSEPDRIQAQEEKHRARSRLRTLIAALILLLPFILFAALWLTEFKRSHPPRDTEGSSCISSSYSPA